MLIEDPIQQIRYLAEAAGVTAAPPAVVARTLTREVFAAAHLGSMLRQQYQDSPYHALTAAYPHLHTWRHEPVEAAYWQGETGITRAQEATRQLLTEVGVAAESPSAIIAAVPFPVFAWYGLEAMLAVIYGGSATAALRAVVPGIRRWRYSVDRLPNGWWQGLAGHERAIAATQAMIGELGWGGLTPAAIGRRTIQETFNQYGLGGMLQIIYASSPYEALHDLFPDLQPWQMAQVPLNYWQGEPGRLHAQRAIRWMLRQLGLASATPAEVGAVVDQLTFVRMDLNGMLKTVYHGSPYEALHDLFPDLQPWQMANVPLSFWQGPVGAEQARAATRWMLEQAQLLDQPSAEIAMRVNSSLFTAMGLAGMLATVYASSPYLALRDLFPDLQPWQMAQPPQHYWRGATGRVHAQAATRWLLEQHHLTGLPPARLIQQVTAASFAEYGLGIMLQRVYRGDVQAALRDAAESGSDDSP